MTTRRLKLTASPTEGLLELVENLLLGLGLRDVPDEQPHVGVGGVDLQQLPWSDLVVVELQVEFE